MRNKLALIIALSGFAAVTALGVGMAGADSAAELGGGNAVEAAPGIATEGTEVIPQCENGIDDDEDGLVDMEDPNCTEPGDPVEGPEPAEPEPAPAPSPSPTPAPTPGTPVEAAPETGPSRPSTGVQAGSSLNAAEAPKPGESPTTRVSTAAPPARGRQRRWSHRPAGDRRRAAGEAGRQWRQPRLQPGRRPHGRQPDDDLRDVRPGPDGSPQLRHRIVRDPALPAADLSGLRHRVRGAVGGPGRDQQNRDRVRHQPQRLLGRGDGLDAVPALELEDVRARRERRRPRGPIQPGRRDLRRCSLPQGRRRPPGPLQGDLRL